MVFVYLKKNPVIRFFFSVCPLRIDMKSLLSRGKETTRVHARCAATRNNTCFAGCNCIYIHTYCTLSSQAKANRGFEGCQATVNVGALHCTSHILSPVSTMACKIHTEQLKMPGTKKVLASFNTNFSLIVFLLRTKKTAKRTCVSVISLNHRQSFDLLCAQ